MACLDKSPDFLAGRGAKWCLRADLVCLDVLPMGGTGKAQKVDLRKPYGGAFSWRRRYRARVPLTT
jgi:hypothetical protein